MANQAAWLMAAKVSPLKVDSAPMPTAAADEVVIRIHASAINPADHLIQDLGMLIEEYPTVLGCDAAGQIAALGSNVKGFNVGDRVMAAVDSTESPTSGTFQLFCAAKSRVVARIPDHVSYAEASVLPLTISTAIEGLFGQGKLGLPYPQIGAKPTGKVVFIWGGSSSVGACAIQLARGAGFEIATTVNLRNFEFGKNLGAKYVFDRDSESVVDDVVNALKDEKFAGVYSSFFVEDSVRKTADIASRLDGNKTLTTSAAPGMPFPEDLPAGVECAASKSLTEPV